MVSINLDTGDVMVLSPPDVSRNPNRQTYLRIMNALEQEFGYLEGDIPVHGVIDAALEIKDQAFLVDLLGNPTLVDHLGGLISQTTCAMALAKINQKENWRPARTRTSP